MAIVGLGPPAYSAGAFILVAAAGSGVVFLMLSPEEDIARRREAGLR